MRGGMDAAVRNQTLDGLLGDLPAVRIEAGQDDRAGRVIDDEIDAGGLFERADVASFAPDDAAFQIVARQVDDRDRGLDGVLGGAALNGFGDVLARFRGGLLARLGIEPLDEIGGIAPRVGLDVLQQQVFGLFGRQARQPFELVLLCGDQLLVFRGGRGGALLALGDRLRLRLQLLLLALERSRVCR